MRREPAQFEGNPTYKSKSSVEIKIKSVNDILLCVCLADYRPWDLSRTQPIKHDASYVPSTGDFGGESTYVYDYKKHNQAPPKPFKPEHAAMQSGNFDDRTGYRDDYIRHNLPTKYNRPKEEYLPNKIPLDSMTTNRRDFTAKDAEKMRSYKPEGTGYRSDAPFDDDTTHKTDFKKWDVQPQQAKRDNDWRPPLGEMDLTTNYNNEFTPKPVSRPQAIKPLDRQRTDAKFEGNTTYDQDFRSWPNGKRDAIRADNQYQPSNVPFDGMSTYKGHYIPLAGAPAQSFKPEGAAFNSNAPFDGNTLYRSEYTHKELEPCAAALLETHRSKFVFHSEDDKGHKFYQKPNQQIAAQ